VRISQIRLGGDEKLALRSDFDGEAYLTGLAEFLPR